MLEFVKSADLEIFNAIQGEIDRENHTFELIASENFVSKAVLQTAGCVMTNKYSEGYPSKRYYGGCEWVDVAVDLRLQRGCAERPPREHWADYRIPAILKH